MFPAGRWDYQQVPLEEPGQDNTRAPPYREINPALNRVYWSAVWLIQHSVRRWANYGAVFAGLVFMMRIHPAMNSLLRNSSDSIYTVKKSGPGHYYYYCTPGVDKQTSPTGVRNPKPDPSWNQPQSLMSEDLKAHVAETRFGIPPDQVQEARLENWDGIGHDAEARLRTRYGGVLHPYEQMPDDYPDPLGIGRAAGRGRGGHQPEPGPAGRGQGNEHQENSHADSHPFVYLGSRVEDIKEFPYVVAIGEHTWPDNILRPIGLPYEPGLTSRRITHTSCTGSIIGNATILTASHCITSPWNTYYITAGTACRPEWGGVWMLSAQTLRVRGFALRQNLHPDVHWNQEGGTARTDFKAKLKPGVPRYVVKNPQNSIFEQNDVGLLYLETPLDLQRDGGQTVKKIKIPRLVDCQVGELQTNPWLGVGPTRPLPRVSTVGWGHIDYNYVLQRNVVSNWLHFFNIPNQADQRQHPDIPPETKEFIQGLQNQNVFHILYPPKNLENLPAGLVLRPNPEPHSSTASGDSGGPWVKRWTGREQPPGEWLQPPREPIQFAVTGGSFSISSRLNNQYVKRTGNTDIMHATKICGDNLAWIRQNFPDVDQQQNW